MRQPLRGLGAGFIASSNYWQRLAMTKVQYVMTPGYPSAKLVPKPSLRGWRGLGSPDPWFGKALTNANTPQPFPCSPGGDTSNCGDPNFYGTADTYVDDNGCVYDTDGNLLTCPGGIEPAPGKVSTLDLPQAPTYSQSRNTSNVVIPKTPPPPPPNQPSGFQQFLSQYGPYLAGGLGLALVLHIFEGAGPGRRR